MRTFGRDHRIGTRDDILVGLQSAVYNAPTQSVTLTTTRPIPLNWAIQVAVNQATDVPSAGVGVANLQGALLDGNGDGSPGGAFVGTINEQARQTFPRFRPPQTGPGTQPGGAAVPQPVPGTSLAARWAAFRRARNG